MYFPASNRALTRTLLAGALVLAGTTACSRPDRSESGTATTDMRDTVQDTTAQGDTAATGYRAMERDTATMPVQSDSARVTEDTSETSQGTTDTTVGISDTSTAEVAAADTTALDAAATEMAGEADTASAGYVEMARDTSGTADQIDTTAGGVNAADTADEAPVNVEAQDTDATDSERVASSEVRTDEVGAAAIGGTVTGADAVAMMTRQGAECTIVDPEENEEVRWDMSSTPVTLNPCGLGSMNLSKVFTAGQRGSGAAGQE
jgi:hypothetical protein